MKWCVGTSNSGENQFKPIYSFKDVDTLVKSRFLKKKILMEMETRGLSKWKSESDIIFFFTCTKQMLQSAVMFWTGEQVMFHLSLTETEREIVRGGGGCRAITERNVIFAYLENTSQDSHKGACEHSFAYWKEFLLRFRELCLCAILRGR